jgi:hypothetical protein
MNWKNLLREIGNIQVYKNGECIVVWYGTTRHTYWNYTMRESVRLFKKRYGIKGKVEKTNFCPFII